MTWILNRYTVGLLLLAAIAAGGWWGVSAIVGAFQGRAAMTEKADKLEAAWLDALEQASAARQDAVDAVNKAAKERQLREDIARVANARNRQTQQDLDHAKRQLEKWKRNASPELARCLDVVVPAGAVSVQHSPEAGPAGAGDQGGAAAAPGAVHGPGARTGSARPAHWHAADEPVGVPSGSGDGQRATGRLAQVGQ